MNERELKLLLRRLTYELRAIRQEIEAFRNDKQTNDNPDHHKAIQPLAVKITETPDLDPARREYYIAENKDRQSAWRQLKPWVETSGVLAAIGIVVLTFCTLVKVNEQVSVARNQLVASVDNFRVDERPWVGISFTAAAKIQVTVGKSFFVPISLINSGKTPAKDVTGNIAIDLVGNGVPIKFTYAPGRASYKIFVGTIFPTGMGSVDRSFESIHHGSDKAEPTIITKPIFDSILANHVLAVIHGRIEYSDPFGTEHWTTFCRNVFNPSVIPIDCMRYNDTDQNR
jgi:hypothetical protein